MIYYEVNLLDLSYYNKYLIEIYFVQNYIIKIIYHRYSEYFWIAIINLSKNVDQTQKRLKTKLM